MLLQQVDTIRDLATRFRQTVFGLREDEINAAAFAVVEDQTRKQFPSTSRLAYEAQKNGLSLIQQHGIISEEVKNWARYVSDEMYHMPAEERDNYVDPTPEKYQSMDYWKQEPAIGEYGFVKSSIPKFPPHEP